MLLGILFVFLGKGEMFLGTPTLVLGTFWFLGTLKWFLGIVVTSPGGSMAGLHLRTSLTCPGHMCTYDYLVRLARDLVILFDV
jgi:hypothetical protein